jgi:hypothetical protein
LLSCFKCITNTQHTVEFYFISQFENLSLTDKTIDMLIGYFV